MSAKVSPYSTRTVWSLGIGCDLWILRERGHAFNNGLTDFRGCGQFPAVPSTIAFLSPRFAFRPSTACCAHRPSIFNTLHIISSRMWNKNQNSPPLILMVIIELSAGRVRNWSVQAPSTVHQSTCNMSTGDIKHLPLVDSNLLINKGHKLNLKCAHKHQPKREYLPE